MLSTIVEIDASKAQFFIFVKSFLYFFVKFFRGTTFPLYVVSAVLLFSFVLPASSNSLVFITTFRVTRVNSPS